MSSSVMKVQYMVGLLKYPSVARVPNGTIFGCSNSALQMIRPKMP